jgi:hypothetical protein
VARGPVSPAATAVHTDRERLAAAAGLAQGKPSHRSLWLSSPSCRPAAGLKPPKAPGAAAPGARLAWAGLIRMLGGLPVPWQAAARPCTAASRPPLIATSL